jgi:hypothetical protein
MKLLVFAAPLLFAALSPAQIPTPLFPRSLKDYLQLTDAQVGAISSLDAAYDRFSAEKQGRIAQVRSSINDLTSADTLDAAALGNAYAEIEAIDRDLRDKQNQLRADLAKALTAVPAARLKSLADAQALLPLASTAECENFLAPLPPFPGSIIPAGYTTGSFSSFLLGNVGAVFVPGVLCGSFSQVSPGGAPVAVFPDELRVYLGLSAAQVSSAASLEGDYLLYALGKQRRVAQVQQSIGDLTNADLLDPISLGAAYAEIEAINRDLRDKRADLRTALGKLLTAPQAAKLKALDDARGLQSIINAAVCESLLAPPAAQFNGVQVPTAVFRSGDFSPLPIPAPGRYCGV